MFKTRQQESKLTGIGNILQENSPTVPKEIWKYDEALAFDTQEHAFTMPTIGFYYQGYLIGIGKATSLKTAKVLAAQQALFSLSKISSN